MTSSRQQDVRTLTLIYKSINTSVLYNILIFPCRIIGNYSRIGTYNAPIHNNISCALSDLESTVIQYNVDIATILLAQTRLTGVESLLSATVSPFFSPSDMSYFITNVD